MQCSSSSSNGFASTERLYRQSSLFQIPPDAEGGEGIQHTLHLRDQQNPLVKGYWLPSLLSVKGRAFPVMPISLFTLYSTSVTALIQHNLSFMESHFSYVKGVTTASGAIGVALFFLMGFRTNSSYARWYDGRRLWSAAAAHLWTLACLLRAGAVRDPKLAAGLMRWALVLVISLKNLHRKKEDLAEMSPVQLPAADMALLASTPLSRRPHLAARELYSLIMAAYSDKQLTVPGDVDRLRNLVDQLTASIPEMSRVNDTPMPWAYIVHLRSFMFVWLAAEPVIYAMDLHWATPLVCFFIGYSLLGMEGISLEVEEPFGADYNDLPLDVLVADTANIAVELAGETLLLGDTAHDATAVMLAAAEGRSSSSNGNS